MSKEIKNLQIQARDLDDNEMWYKVMKTFDENPDIIQKINIDCGNGLVGRITMTNQMESATRGYYQLEDIFPITIADRFQQYCEESGEVLPGGIYRIFYELI